MSYHLFLDDERKPHNVTWVDIPRVIYEVVRNYEEFVNLIETSGVPEYVTFDHDLCEEHYMHMLKDCQLNSTGQLLFEVANDIQDYDYGPTKTGYDCAKWLADYCVENNLKFPRYNVHTMNPIGGERIKRYIVRVAQLVE